MAKQSITFPIVLRWSEHVPASDVQDPLGLGLRGSARLASRLLYCITSITPRARYFSFLPWCVYDYQQREIGQSHALGLRDAVVLREQALTLACIARHNGEACQGGAIVGSRDAAKWFAKGEKDANFKKMKRFSKNPALAAYLNSLVNLGFFVTDGERPDSDEEDTSETITFDDIKLSELGIELAKRYDLGVARLTTTKEISSKERSCSLAGLVSFGTHGGLCELANKDAADRDLLRDIFFGVTGSTGDSHRVRRQSLLLLLELCHQLGSSGWVLDHAGFAGAVYYGAVVNEEDKLEVTIPSKLADISTRWRMFYFHHYMAVALEGLFSWLISQLGGCGLGGASITSLVSQLGESSLRRTLSEILNTELPSPLSELSPRILFACLGLPDGDLTSELSKTLDTQVHSLTPFAEDSLEGIIRANEHLYSSTGLALPMILLMTTLARYTQWETTNFGMWLASAANDPYLDLIPPVLTQGLTRRFGRWWDCTWSELAEFVLFRYVVQQHQSMSYEKSWSGDRCLLQVDGQRIVSTGGYDKIGLGNPRFWSAIQVLKDLGLMEDDEDGVSHLTMEGKQFCKREIAAKEGQDEVS